MGARYYDAQVGRFITRDTYLDEHPYLYCEHEPVNFVDPSGHIPLLLAFAIGAGIGLLLQGAKDVVDDGKVNDPWWNYVGAGGLGGVGGVGVGAAKGGVTVGKYPIKIERFRRGGGGLNIYKPPYRLKDTVFGAHWHKWYDKGGEIHTGIQ